MRQYTTAQRFNNLTTPVVTVHKGSDIGVTIQLGLTMTRGDLPRTVFEDDARTLYRELRSHLPAGTYERLRQLFAEDK